jgi:hypothetical protein
MAPPGSEIEQYKPALLFCLLKNRVGPWLPLDFVGAFEFETREQRQK